MRHSQVLSLFSILLFAAGCGSSSSSSNNDEPDPMGDDTPETLSLNGNAADGYLRGATVCLDTDGDRACAGEATSTTTGENGAFTLSATAEEFQRFPIITEVVAGTVDEDTINDENPQGTPITQEETYTLAAPPNSVPISDDDGDGTIEARVFVSPITTIVEQTRQQLAADNPDATITEALQQARTEVATSLGTDTAALTTDYVAILQDEESDESAMTSARQLHTTARVVADLLADVEADIETAVSAGDIANEQTATALQVAIEQLTDRLEQISQQVEDVLDELASDEGETEANTIIKAVETIANANDVVQPDTLGDLIDSANAETTAVTAADVIQRDGGVWVVGIDSYFDGENQEVEVWADNFGFTPADGDTAAVSIDDCFTVDVETSELTTDEDGASSEIVLTEDGWTSVETPAGDDCHLEFALGDDGSVSGTTPDGESLTFDAPVQQLELQDLSIASLLTLHDTVSEVAWPYVLTDDATFSAAEATGFVITGTSTEAEHYSLGSSEDFNNSFNVVGYHLGHDTFEPELDSLDRIIHEAGTELFDANGVLDDSIAFIGVGEGISSASATAGQSSYLSLFLADSTATYFSRTYNPETGETEAEVLGTTPFTLNTVNGARLLQIPVIDEIAEFDLYYSVDNADSDKPFVYTEYQGAVRFVFFEPDEVETFSVLALNESARDDLIGAFNTNHFDIRAALPRNLPALNPLIAENAAFDNSGETIFFTNWWFRPTRENRVWTVNEAITDPNTGIGNRERPSPYNQDIALRSSTRSVVLAEGLWATQADTNEVIYLPGTPDELIAGERALGEPGVTYITGIEEDGDDTVRTYCFRSLSEIREGDLACLPAEDRLAEVNFLSRSQDAIVNRALELTANNQTIGIDQAQFVGNRLYTFEFYAGEDGTPELDRLEITLNDDEAKSVTVHEQDITDVNLSYEFNDYGLQISGTLVADGETEELSEFLLLREYHEADEVYSACWKNAENNVTSVAEAVNACALDYGEDRTRSVITLSEARANAIEEAGSFAPSSSGQ